MSRFPSRDLTGRAGAVVSIVGFLGFSLAQMVPVPIFNRSVNAAVRPVRKLGLEQGWGMFVFTPDPPPSSRVVEARLTFDDGRVTRWTPPMWNMWRDQRSVRWEKYVEHVRPGGYVYDQDNPELWPRLAVWLAHTQSTDDVSVIRVELISRDKPIRPMSDRTDAPWTDNTYYRQDFGR